MVSIICLNWIQVSAAWEVCDGERRSEVVTAPEFKQKLRENIKQVVLTTLAL